MIRAFAQLRKTRYIRLVILGEGPERTNLERLTRELEIQDDVMFLGFKNNPYGYMARATLFVLSSTIEGLPNVLVEAMTLGTPIVSTDCESGPREILENGKYGKLVPVGNVDQLALAMESQILNPTDKKLLLKRAQDFSIETVVEKFINIIGFSPLN